MTEGTPWWRDAVIYQVYPRSFADSDGDGIGDIPGVTSRLDHLVDLGIDALWLSPFYPSPQRDAGYDVADHRDVEPLFGTLDDFDELVAQAHERGMRVVVDVVPNHTSSEHAWFQAALASAPGSPERERYVFREGRGDGSEPPNNWESLFGGPAWTRVTEPDGRAGTWYLHLFDSSQPDLDWTNPEVGDEMEAVLRFWLDRGVDGFRIDVAHGLVKAPGLPDTDLSLDPHRAETSLMPMWDQPGVHDVYRRWRRLIDAYDGDRLLVAEAWVEPPEALARYVRPDELHQSFNFHFLLTPWRADALRSSITESLAHAAEVGAPQTWVLSNHDVVRHASRLGLPGVEVEMPEGGVGPDDPQPDPVLGLRRARAATALMLALPGSAYLYQGEELGLPDATLLPDDVRQDPTYFRSDGPGRDGCRVPVPWASDQPSFGFGPSDRTWLPQPAEYGSFAPDRQRDVDDSTLELYRTLLRLRRELRFGVRDLAWLDLGPDVVAFDLAGLGGTTRVIANLGGTPVHLPDGFETLALSGPLDDGRLPTDTTVWIRPTG